MDLRNLFQLGLIILNGLPLAISEGRGEAKTEVAIRHLSFVSHTNLYWPEICYTVFRVLWRDAIAKLNTGRFFSCLIKKTGLCSPCSQ